MGMRVEEYIFRLRIHARPVLQHSACNPEREARHLDSPRESLPLAAEEAQVVDVGDRHLRIHRQREKPKYREPPRDAWVEALERDIRVHPETFGHDPRVERRDPVARGDDDGADLHAADGLQVEAASDVGIPAEASILDPDLAHVPGVRFLEVDRPEVPGSVVPGSGVRWLARNETDRPERVDRRQAPEALLRRRWRCELEPCTEGDPGAMGGVHVELSPRERQERAVELDLVEPQDPLEVAVSAPDAQLPGVNPRGEEGPASLVVDVHGVGRRVDDPLEERRRQEDVDRDQIRGFQPQRGDRNDPEHARGATAQDLDACARVHSPAGVCSPVHKGSRGTSPLRQPQRNIHAHRHPRPSGPTAPPGGARLGRMAGGGGRAASPSKVWRKRGSFAEVWPGVQNRHASTSSKPRILHETARRKSC